MKVKNIVRKAVALSSGAALVGTTLMGALAYDLATYPAKYIVDGKFDGKIVVGEKAATADVLGSIDIAASLQGASVSKVALPGEAGKMSFEGDVFEVATSSDALELREEIGEVAETITSDELAGLKSGKLTTPEGSTNYQQYLRLQDGTELQDIAVNYVTNDGVRPEKMADYMVVENVADKPFIRWEIQFDEGFEAEVEGTGTIDLSDYEDRTLNVMGTDYNIVSAEVDDDGTGFEMVLMGGSVPITLRQGETKTYSINGVDYDVTLVFVSDPSGGSASEPEAKFSVNGELTQTLAAGDTDTLTGGVQIGVRDLLVNPREAIATFYIGAQKLVFIDNNINNTNFTGGDIEINEDVTADDVLKVEASFTSSMFEITSIEYQVVMESADGASGVAYVPKGHGVRELMEDPGLLISDALDIKYGGLTTPKTAEFVFEPDGSDAYMLSFTNIEGDEYDVPFLTTDDDGVLNFGDADDDLVLVEVDSLASANIGIDDYFVVSSKQGSEVDRAVTNVLRYVGYDGETRKIEFENLAGGIVGSTLGSNGQGTFNVGGHTYPVKVKIAGGTSASADDDANIIVDLDGSGTIVNGSMPVFTNWGGFSLRFLSAVDDSNTITTASASLLTTIGDGKNLTSVLNNGSAVLTFNASVAERKFDTANGAEFFTVQIEENDAQDELDIEFGSYVGPVDNSANIWTKFEFAELEKGSDVSVGMTDYGLLVELDDSDDPSTLTVTVPEEQVLAQVFVTMGSVTATESGTGGSADKVNPIAVGLAILDKDAAGMIGKENLLVVGGPCANTVALELLENPAKCSEGFEAGKAMIRSWDKTGTVAILVAGYEATETLGASRVLADYKAYSLKGDNVEVVVTSLDSIQVKSATTN